MQTKALEKLVADQTKILEKILEQVTRFNENHTHIEGMLGLEEAVGQIEQSFTGDGESTEFIPPAPVTAETVDETPTDAVE